MNCAICRQPLRDEEYVHEACAQEDRAAQEQSDREIGPPVRPDDDDEITALAVTVEPPDTTCSRCGDDPYWCPCTTGWSPVRGMLW